MLSRDVRFEGFATEHWLALLSLFGPAREHDQPARGGLLAVCSGQRLRKLFSTAHGRLDARAEPWPVPLEALARRHRAAFVLAFEAGALDLLMDRWSERLKPEHGYTAQLLELVRVAADLERENQLTLWPWRLGDWLLPSERAVHTALDGVLPEGRSALLGVFERGGLATCLALARGPGGIDRILGPDVLRPAAARFTGEAHRDFAVLAAAAECALGPLALGCYAERATWQRLLASSRPPGSWATAVLAREVVLAPAPAILAVPLGIDLARAGSRWIGEHSDTVLLPLIRRLFRRIVTPGPQH